MRPPDRLFADPRLAPQYDRDQGERDDLEPYRREAVEHAASLVVDIGCGTGELALRLAAEGIAVLAIDPAAAMLDVARRKPGAERVTWLEGDAGVLADRRVNADLAVLTGNTAQAIVTDDDWHATLRSISAALRPGGRLMLETRDPAAQAWESWEHPPTPTVLASGQPATVGRTVDEVSLPLVTFTDRTFVDGCTLTSTSTLRFRTEPEVIADLQRHGLHTEAVGGAPDRPGQELVFRARKHTAMRTPHLRR